MLCQRFLPTGYVAMRWLQLIVRVPDAGILPIQRILVQEEPLLGLPYKMRAKLHVVRLIFRALESWQSLHADVPHRRVQSQ